MPFEVVIADTGRERKHLVEAIEAKGAEAVTPTLINRKQQWQIDTARYSDRPWPSGAGTRPIRSGGGHPLREDRSFPAFVRFPSIMILSSESEESVPPDCPHVLVRRSQRGRCSKVPWPPSARGNSVRSHCRAFSSPRRWASQKAVVLMRIRS